MPKAKSPKSSRKRPITLSADRIVMFDDLDLSDTNPPEPPYVPNWTSRGAISPAEMWRAFLREYATPLAKAPGWFAADGFRIELADGRELPVTANELNPTADTLLVLRTRTGVNGREEVSTSAVPWSQVGRISVVTHNG